MPLLERFRKSAPQRVPPTGQSSRQPWSLAMQAGVAGSTAQSNIAEAATDAVRRERLIARCSNPACRSGWLSRLRPSGTPVFESGWTCSPDCTRDRLALAVRRELDGRSLSAAPEAHPHRIPIGLLMLENGWITSDNLRLALKSQKDSGEGRLGDWLIRLGAADERAVTRAVALQWSTAVLPLDYHDAEAMASFLPRLLIDAYGALPLRLAANKVLYLGFEEKLDASVILAAQRVTGLRVEAGIVATSDFRPAFDKMLRVRYPAVELIEATSEPAAVLALSKSIERAKPLEARLCRVHDLLWLRMWQSPPDSPRRSISDIRDVLCSLGLRG